MSTGKIAAALKNEQLLKGLLLVAIALLFGVQALTLPFGSFTRAGPGLFPVIVSGTLLVVALAIIARSRVVKAAPLDFKLKGITIVVASLILFVFVSEHVNMLAGIVSMVFVASLAGHDFNATRSLTIAAALSLVALAMHKLLGFQLPLF